MSSRAPSRLPSPPPKLPRSAHLHPLMAFSQSTPRVADVIVGAATGDGDSFFRLIPSREGVVASSKGGREGERRKDKGVRPIVDSAATMVVMVVVR